MGDIDDVRAAITPNTVGLMGSTPCFSYGVFDPIEELGALALEHDIQLHVDCCLGSYLVPILKGLGYPIPKFAFECPGVSSLSTDTHKYGFSCKGSSVLLFKNEDYRHYCFFSVCDWSGGIYATPSIPGSRAGCISACTWAVMLSLGREGYEKIAKDIIDTTNEIRKGISEMPEYEILGDPCSSVFSWRWAPGLQTSAPHLYCIYEAMKTRRWSIKRLQGPKALHMCMTNVHSGKAQSFLTALRESTDEVLANPNKYRAGAAMYAAGVDVPDESVKTGLI